MGDMSPPGIPARLSRLLELSTLTAPEVDRLLQNRLIRRRKSRNYTWDLMQRERNAGWQTLAPYADLFGTTLDWIARGIGSEPSEASVARALATRFACRPGVESVRAAIAAWRAGSRPLAA